MDFFKGEAKQEIPPILQSWENFITLSDRVLVGSKGFKDQAVENIKVVGFLAASISQNHEAIQALLQLQPAFDKNEIIARAITTISSTEKIFASYFDYLKTIMQDLIAQLDALANDFNTTRELRKKWNQQSVDLKNALSKSEQATKKIMGAKAGNSGVSNTVGNLGFFKTSPKEIYVAQAELKTVMRTELKSFDAVVEQYFQLCARIQYSFVASLVKTMADLHNKLLSCYKELHRSTPTLKDLEAEIVAMRKKHTDYPAASVLRDRLKKEADHADYNRYTKLTELLCQEGTILLQCIGSMSDDDTLPTIVKILDAHGMAMPLIRRGIVAEVAETKDPTTLFRGNSVSTKLMSAFTKMTGEKYLNSIIIETLQKLVDSDLSYEIDPVKAEPGDEIDENQFRLIQACQDFLDLCILSIDQVPIPFRMMANLLEQEVAKRYPNSAKHAIASLMFLRFFCPALSTFDSKTVWPGGLPKKAKRAAVLIGKIIQTLANGQHFGAKENYLLMANSFLDSNVSTLMAYLDEIALVPTTDYIPICSMKDCHQVEAKKLHYFLVRNLEKIGFKLMESTAAEGSTELFYTLVSILGDLGEIDQEIEPYTPVMIAFKEDKKSKKDKK